jgi:uncharacterized membrane protein YfcA
MDPGTLGAWVGGIVGSLLGVGGGVFGTYCTIKHTKGPRERAFTIKGSIICWVFVVAFLVGMSLIPQWYNLLLVVPYVIILVFGVRKGNQIQLRIRKEESGQSA